MLVQDKLKITISLRKKTYMKKILGSLIIMCSLIMSVSAQEKTMIIPGENIAALDLMGADYISQRLVLTEAQNIQIKLIDIVSKDIGSLPKNLKLSNSFDPDVFFYTERKQPVIGIKIPLYIKENNSIKQLASYNLEVKYSVKPQGKEAARPTDVSNSVLSTGSWYKIAISKKGIYKMDYAFLQNLGINPTNINPKNIRVYGNGGSVLSEIVNSTDIDDLAENAIFVSSNGTSFAQNDYILFYANGPVEWIKELNNPKFTHTNNYYEDKSYYFLNFDLGIGKRIENENATGTADVTFNNFNDYAVIDIDSFNVGDMGKIWWSNPMNTVNTSSLTSNLSIDLKSVTGPILMESHVGNKSDANGNLLKISINNQQQKLFTLNSSGQNFINDQYSSDSFNIASPMLNIKLQYLPVGNGIAYLDYLRFNYYRPLSFQGGQMAFRNIASLDLASNEKAAYPIQNANANVKVWDISNPLKPIELSGNRNGNTYTITRNGAELNEFIAYDGSTYYTPAFIGTVANQNLHGLGATDFLIITNDDFWVAANDLANFHRQRDNMTVEVVKVKDIYNEFSSGSQDIAGIRNFIKMFYDRATNDEEMIKNVLMFGAASYDYKDRIKNNTNFVPTFQSMQSVYVNDAYSSDDFFGLLDNGESMNSGLLDIGIGRIPCFTETEGENAVAKIKRYVSAESFGPWKNVISFVADDKESGMNHLEDCETINSFFTTSDPTYNVYKIYEDAFQSVASSAGIRYPAVNKAINDQIYNGTFLMSYSGHGSPSQWSHEAILTPSDYNNWTNKNKLPVMITATCDFGRFDDPGVRSAGALLMLNPDGGSIAMITTTQAVFANYNTRLSKNFIDKQFTKNAAGKFLTLGEALTAAKNISFGGVNDHKFTVLGDPALTLQIPKYQVKTDSILMEQDGGYITTDTIQALGKYIIKGSVKDNNDAVLNNFNGTVYITVFDKKTTVQTVNDFPGTDPSFNLQTNAVARIKSNVTNGHFSANFLAPKDINYQYGSGKISYYAHDDQVDANGLDTEVTVGGTSQYAGSDNTPPIVKPYIDDEHFKNGSAVGPNPLLFVKLFDDNGINVSGNSLGHDLVAILDDDIQNPFILNDYYQTQENDYKNGYLNFPLYNLTDGPHTIRVKAWDAFNNSGEGTVHFVVKNKGKGFIDELYNYPNPVKDITHFVFQHNQKGEEMSVTLQIFNTMGSLMKSIDYDMKPEGNRSEITWDLKGNDGVALAKGLYPYRLIINTKNGKSATAYQKLVIMR